VGNGSKRNSQSTGKDVDKQEASHRDIMSCGHKETDSAGERLLAKNPLIQIV
jgi:hypothetical protein